MNNRIKEKLMNARVYCPEFSDDMYALTDRVACVVENNTSPSELIKILASVEYFLELAEEYEILDQIALFPQVIDMITDENYGQEFKRYFNTAFADKQQSIKERENSTNEFFEYIFVVTRGGKQEILCKIEPQEEKGQARTLKQKEKQD